MTQIQGRAEQQSRNALCSCGSGKKYKKCCLARDEAQRKPHSGEDAVIVCMPTRGQVCYETMLALQANLRDVKHIYCTMGRKPIVEARNSIARSALSVLERNPLPFTPREWFALWVDDDAWWPPGAVGTMLRALKENPKIDAVFGKFGGREPFSKIFAYRDAGDGESYPKAGIDCRHGDLVPIERAGFHWVLMRLSLLERVGENPFDIPEGSNISEDFAFCDRAHKIGATLVLADGCPIVHIDPRDGAAYLPGMATMMMDGNATRAFDTRHATPLGIRKGPELRQYGDELSGMMSVANSEADTKRKEFELRHNHEVDVP